MKIKKVYVYEFEEVTEALGLPPSENYILCISEGVLKVREVKE